jgi:hypothetical protein
MKQAASPDGCDMFLRNVGRYFSFVFGLMAVTNGGGGRMIINLATQSVRNSICESTIPNMAMVLGVTSDKFSVDIICTYVISSSQNKIKEL